MSKIISTASLPALTFSSSGQVTHCVFHVHCVFAARSTSSHGPGGLLIEIIVREQHQNLRQWFQSLDDHDTDTF